MILLITYLIQPSYGAAQLQGLAIGALPLAMATVAQAIVVISGGIDLSIGSMMAFTSVTAAVLMKDQPEAFAIPVVDRGPRAGPDPGHRQRHPGRDHPRPGHRRDPGDVVRLGRRGPPGPAHARRRLGRLADGSRHGVHRERVDPAGPGHAARSSSGSSGSRCAARTPASRCTPSAATGWPRSGVASRSGGRRSSPTCSAACSRRSAAWR